MDHRTAYKKKETLIQRLTALDNLLIAFSGGVDSTFLLAVAHQCLGDRVLAVTARSIIQPARETNAAERIAARAGIPHRIIHSEEMSLPEFVANTGDRCYHCKRHILESLWHVAREEGFSHVAHGANRDDLGDYRPGFRAAREMGVLAPLMEAELEKAEIRFLSKEMDLPTWDKPPVPCLASRIPYGSPVTEEKLRAIDRAEAFLLGQGFQSVRVRHHGPVARIEVERHGLEKFADQTLRKGIVREFRKLGFLHVALDLEGFVSGSMNRALRQEPGRED